MMAGAKMLAKVATRLAYFTSNSWYFAIHNTEALRETLNHTDAELFPMDIGKLNWEIWAIHFCEGLKKFILKETDETEVDRNRRSTTTKEGPQTGVEEDPPVKPVSKAKL